MWILTVIAEVIAMIPLQPLVSAAQQAGRMTP